MAGRALDAKMSPRERNEMTNKYICRLVKLLVGAEGCLKLPVG